MNRSAMITCPNCKTRVLPKADGTCPSCQFLIPQSKGSSSKKIDLAKGNRTSAHPKQEPSPVIKITNGVADEDKTSRGQTPIRPNGKAKKNKEIAAANERHMSKEEYKEKYRQQRVHHDPNMPRPNPVPVDQGKAPPKSRVELAISKAIQYSVGLMIFLGIGGWLSEHAINLGWILKAGLLGAVITFIIYAVFSNPGDE